MRCPRVIAEHHILLRARCGECRTASASRRGGDKRRNLRLNAARSKGGAHKAMFPVRIEIGCCMLHGAAAALPEMAARRCNARRGWFQNFQKCRAIAVLRRDAHSFARQHIRHEERSPLTLGNAITLRAEPGDLHIDFCVHSRITAETGMTFQTSFVGEAISRRLAIAVSRPPSAASTVSTICAALSPALSYISSGLS